MDESSAAGRSQPHESLPETVCQDGAPRSRAVALRQRTQGHVVRGALVEFVADARVRNRRTAPALWGLLGLGAAVCVVLIGVVDMPQICRGVACSVATFGGRPELTLAFAASGTIGLLMAALTTRGFTRIGSRGPWLVAPAAAVTAASVFGALVVLVATMAVVAAGAIVVFLACALMAER